MIDRRSVAKWKRQVKRMPAKAEQYVEDAMVKNGEEATKYMKLLVPVDDGSTRDSIFYYTKQVPTGIQLVIGAGDGAGSPARIVEYVNNDAFFYPTLRLQGKRYRGRYKRAINKAAKEIANG